MLKMGPYLSTPVAVYINEQKTIHLIQPARVSLHQRLHLNKEKLSEHTKLVILI